MTDALAQSWLTFALPVAIIAGSMLVSKLLKLSLLGTIAAACVPLALPFIDLPFSQELTHRNPHYLIGAGWLVLISIAVGWVVVRPLASSALQNFGIIKCAYVLLLAAALAVVGLLLGNPAVLNTYVPGWKGTAGMVLLCASMLSMSLALIRFFRAAVFLAVWSFVSLVLASEIFLGKLPQQVIREDIDKIEELFPSAKVNAILKKYGVEEDLLRVRDALEES